MSVRVCAPVNDCAQGGAAITGIGEVPTVHQSPGPTAPPGRTVRVLEHRTPTLAPSWAGLARRPSGWIPARCPGSHCPPVAIPETQGPGAGVGSAKPQITEVPAGQRAPALGPLQENGKCSGLRYWTDQDSARCFHRPSRGGANLGHLQAGRRPAFRHTHQSHLPLPAAPGGRARSRPCPRPGLPSGFPQMSCEFGTPRSDHRGLGAAGGTAPSPGGRTLRAAPGLG